MLYPMYKTMFYSVYTLWNAYIQLIIHCTILHGYHFVVVITQQLISLHFKKPQYITV
jgi:hypothetical protein